MEPNGGKKRCIDDIIEHMTAEFGGFEGQYLLLGGQTGGGGSSAGGVSGGGSATSNGSGAPSRPGPLTASPSPQQQQQQQGRWPPPGVQQPQQPPQVYYPQQGELGMVDVGNGNYVVFSKPNPEFNQPVGFIHYQQPPQTLVQPHIIDCRQSRPFNEGMTNGCLIENVVGNWVPNRTGTYSPFGGTLPHEEPAPLIQLPHQQQQSVQAAEYIASLPGQIVPQMTSPQTPPSHSATPPPPPASSSSSNCQQQQQQQQQPVKRQRIVAEVKPMRPSYSDVLAKSAPLTPPPSAKVPSNKSSAAGGGSGSGSGSGGSKHTPNYSSGASIWDVTKTSKPDSAGRKQQNKNSKTQAGGKNVPALKRQSSSGSDEALAEKVRASGGTGMGNGAGNKWSSQEELLVTSKPTRNHQQHNASDLNNKTKRDQRKTKTIKPQDRFDFGEGFEEDDDDDDDDNDDEYEEERSGKERSMGKTGERTLNTSKPKSRDDKKGSASKSERGVLNSSGRNAKGKRGQRSGRRRDTYLGLLVKKWQEKSSLYLYLLTVWLWRLLYDVTAMSTSLLLHFFGEAWGKSVDWFSLVKTKSRNMFGKSDWRGGNAWWRRFLGSGGASNAKKEKRFSSKKSHGGGGGDTNNSSSQLPGSLSHNITLPTTGEEAMKRLLSCKGKDPYSILGVTNACTDEEIKRYYKSQALLVHPDKNSQPGAEEAFKILVHAFDLIAVPEKRAAYDRYVAETNQVEQAWSELSDLLSQLHEKMEYAANTIRCNNCGKRHTRQLTERPSYAARFCAQCKIHHSAKEGDMWAESRGWGGWWGVRYYACMEGSVYDITQWANCQGNTIQKVKPDSHAVQYRVLMGRAPQNQPPPSEPDFEDLLTSLYSQGGSTSRNKKKSKKNK